MFFRGRGRGANVGVSAPAIVVRLAGAAVAFATVLVAESLGLLSVATLPAAPTRAVAAVVGALVAPSAVGYLLWVAILALSSIHFFVSFTPVVKPLVSHFVRNDAPSNNSQVVIVLSGGMNDEGKIARQGLARLISGMQLAKYRGIQTIALSVISDSYKGRSFDSEADQRALIQLGVPTAEVKFVRDVYSTYDEALAFAALARTYNWQSVIVVTSPLHTARACAVFEKSGLTVECHAADLREYSINHLYRPENRRKAFGDILYEYVATAVYRARGRL